MITRPRLAMLLACVLATPLSLLAQKTTQVHPGQAGSPHVRTEWMVGGASISIEYGRPYLKGRTIGKDVAPYGQVWRTGADEATTLKTDAILVFGSVTLAPGTYTLWTLPAQGAWKLIVNKQTGQWGTQYSQAQDLGRIDMKVDAASPPAEQVTFGIDAASGGGTLKVEWGSVRASVPFTVKK